MLFFIIEKIFSFVWGPLQDLGALGARLIRLLVNAPLSTWMLNTQREPIQQWGEEGEGPY